jgi:hypothetical protein
MRLKANISEIIEALARPTERVREDRPKMKLVSVGHTARRIPRPAEVRRIFGMTAVE